ncbi:MAG: DUF512 domain-containing protein [Firmicutes bacterium]|jgi:putative radical SAM enzyme (TIGR03279 family)|nr:DUF512 domain-containing protein [Bacillota bacterium]
MLKDRGFIINGIKKGTPADRTGIETGDSLLKINGLPFYDLLDYYYLCAERELTLTIRKKVGIHREYRVIKEYDEDLGLEFISPTIGPVRYCRNHCVFCFIDQQPPVLRPSLFEKDDDYRLSFFHGNYITLTNTGDLDLKRIIRRGLSPLYISIHSTDPAIRRKMMGNRFAGRILEQLSRLASAGIVMHGQIVVCPGLNDGVHLQKTVRDLSKLHPALRTVALVPVGLTRYRQGLPALKGITPADAADIVKYYSGLQAEFKKNLGTPFVYLADEFYLLSGFPIPSDEHYGNYEQVENGVGLGRLFLNELEQWRKTPAPSLPGEIQISLVTAQSGSPFLKLFLAELEKIRGIKANLHVLTNEFWGGNVTVTGLLTGSDLLSGLAQKELGQVVFIPAVMLREGTDLFLDDISLRELASKLEVQIVPVNHLSEIRSYLIGHPQRA